MKRYDMQNVSKGWDAVYEMVEVSDGEWVRYEDAKAINETLTLAQRELKCEYGRYQQLMDQYIALKGEHEKLANALQDDPQTPCEHNWQRWKHYDWCPKCDQTRPVIALPWSDLHDALRDWKDGGGSLNAVLDALSALLQKTAAGAVAEVEAKTTEKDDPYVVDVNATLRFVRQARVHDRYKFFRKLDALVQAKSNDKLMWPDALAVVSDQDWRDAALEISEKVTVTPKTKRAP